MSVLRIGAVVRSHVNSYTSRSFISQNNSFKRFFSVTRTANMKFVQFSYNNNPNEVRAGYMVEGGVVDINKADNCLASTVLGILKNDQACKVLDLLTKKPPVVPTNQYTLKAPITGMDKILCIGLNYRDHCKERNQPEPKVPMMFSKFASCIIGPNDTVKVRDDVVKQLDYEVELVVIIGQKCSKVKSADALSYVFGYTIAQDITSRDWQTKNGGQFLLGKCQDTFCPIGPCIVTTDEVCDPSMLDISCKVNGQIKQNSNTCNLIHSIPDVIERLSSVMTLLPGDMLLTGTPGGVGAGFNPPQFLKPGDVIHSEIQCIGSFDVKVERF